MGFNDNKFNKRSFGKRSFDSSAPRQMHKAVCSTCGKDCMIPFKPSGNKPVYCSDCFEKTNERSGPRNFDNRTNRTSPDNIQFEILSAKLDKILTILTSPSKSKSKDEIKEK